MISGELTQMAALLARLTPGEQVRILRLLPAVEKRHLNDEWEAWAHAGQLPPEGDWRVWLIRAGRGFGKTRAGAEWVSAVARATPGARIALVGATRHEVQRIMVEGESGVMAVRRSGEHIVWRPSVDVMPPPARVVVGVDPPAGTLSGQAGDACGIVAVALGEDGDAYVIEDASVVGAHSAIRRQRQSEPRR